MTLTCACGTTLHNIPDYLLDACPWACGQCIKRAQTNNGTAIRLVEKTKTEKTRVCRVCGNTFPIAEFYTKTVYSSNRIRECKTCHNKRKRKEYRESQVFDTDDALTTSEAIDAFRDGELRERSEI